MDGRELIVKSKTGSGKTLAFLLPLVEMIQASPDRNKLQTIILEPTRELAVQVQEHINKMTRLKSVVVTGGGVQSPYSNMNHIRAVKPHIIVATPGRLIDLIENHGL